MGNTVCPNCSSGMAVMPSSIGLRINCPVCENDFLAQPQVRVMRVSKVKHSQNVEVKEKAQDPAKSWSGVGPLVVALMFVLMIIFAMFDSKPDLEPSPVSVKIVEILFIPIMQLANTSNQKQTYKITMYDDGKVLYNGHISISAYGRAARSPLDGWPVDFCDEIRVVVDGFMPFYYRK